MSRKNVRNCVHKRYNGVELSGIITSINDGRIDVRLIHPLKGESFICFSSASAMAGKYVFNADGSISKEGKKAALEALVWAYEDALKKKKMAETIFEIRLRTFDKLNKIQLDKLKEQGYTYNGNDEGDTWFKIELNAKEEVLSIEPLEGNNPVAYFRKVERGVNLPIFEDKHMNSREEDSEEYLELNDETKKVIKERIKEIKEGKVLSSKELKDRLFNKNRTDYFVGKAVNQCQDFFKEKEEPKLNKENKERTYLVGCRLTRAEYLSETERKELGKDKGLVIEEKRLQEEDLRKEFEEILKELEFGKEQGFRKYIQFMVESIKSTICSEKEDIDKLHRLLASSHNELEEWKEVHYRDMNCLEEQKEELHKEIEKLKEEKKQMGKQVSRLSKSKLKYKKRISELVNSLIKRKAQQTKDHDRIVELENRISNKETTNQ